MLNCWAKAAPLIVHSSLLTVHKQKLVHPAVHLYMFCILKQNNVGAKSIVLEYYSLYTYLY